MLFKPTRPDGRSYRDVAVDIFKDLPPGTIVSYEKIAAALDIDDPKSLRVRQIVRTAIKPLLKLHQRGLTCVSGKGYRVLPAHENMIVAGNHRSKADKAMGRALEYLHGANRSEMTEAHRRLHDGQCVIMQALYASHHYLDTRMNKIEKLLRGGSTIQHD